MAETPSNMIALNSKAPDFQLVDTVSQAVIALQAVKSSIATVILFLSNHCPYVKHIQTKLVEVANQYQAKGLCFIAIAANDIVSYPQDGPDYMRLEAKKHDYPFPYLFDATQEIAKAYQAACTPDFFVFDSNLYCVYRGRFDSATPGNQQPVTGKDLTDALDAILAGRPVPQDQKPSLGCNIKWKKVNSFLQLA